MRIKNGFVAQLIYKDCFAGRAFYLLQENRKRGQDKDMPICVVFFPIAESMVDRTAIELLECFAKYDLSLNVVSIGS